MDRSESLNLFFKEIQHLDPLTKELEHHFAKKAKAGCERSRAALVNHNLKIVVTIANKNQHRGIPVDDLIQEGSIALIDSIDRFDPDAGVRFASFAGTRVLKYMNRLIDQCGRIVRIPVNQEYERYQKKKRGEEVESLVTAKLECSVSDDGKKTFGDTLAQASEVDAAFEKEHIEWSVDRLLNSLKDRDRKVMELHYGIGGGDPVGTKEISEILGLTQVRVCQIVKSSKQKMKDLCEQ